MEKGKIDVVVVVGETLGRRDKDLRGKGEWKSGKGFGYHVRQARVSSSNSRPSDG